MEERWGGRPARYPDTWKAVPGMTFGPEGVVVDFDEPQARRDLKTHVLIVIVWPVAVLAMTWWMFRSAQPVLQVGAAVAAGLLILVVFVNLPRRLRLLTLQGPALFVDDEGVHLQRVHFGPLLIPWARLHDVYLRAGNGQETLVLHADRTVVEMGLMRRLLFFDPRPSMKSAVPVLGREVKPSLEQLAAVILYHRACPVPLLPAKT